MYAVETGSPENETIVFLHGNGMAGWMWQNITEQLDQDYHCVVFDLPGSGSSAQIGVDSLVHTADLVAQEVKTRFGGKSVHLVGLSLGGMLTTLIASRHPQLVRRAVASGVNALPVPRMWLYRLIGSIMALLIKRGFYIRFNAKLYGVPEEQYSEFHAISKKQSAKAFKTVLRDALVFRVPENAAHIHTPILFVAGSKELQVNIDSVAALAESMPHSTGCIAPDVGHAWSAENPQLFAKMVRAWLSDSPLPHELDIKVRHPDALTLTL